MTALRWLSAFVFALALAAGAGLLLQWQAEAQLRGEIALLREERSGLVRLQAEHDRLVAVQPSAGELEQLRGDRAALERLRGELAGLKARADEMARAAERAALPLTPLVEMRNAGRATPAAVAETLYWAAANRDPETIAAMLSFEPKLRRAVDLFFGTLPEDVRTKYGTVERLIGAFTADELAAAAAMRVVEEMPADGDRMELIVRTQSAAGFARERPLVFIRTDDGWRLAVAPRMVQNIANQIASQMGAGK
jgi:hypothetical protein